MRRRFETISVIGLGYIGLPTAAIFASRKVRVVGVDVNPHTVETINRGEAHIVEPDLDIAVPTPFTGNNHEADLSFVEQAARTIAPVLVSGNLIVLESTCPVGTTEQMAAWLAEARPDLTFPQSHGEASDIRIVHCPERVLPGKVMLELIHNDRVLGGLSPRCSEMALSLYRTFVEGECVITDARTAEMAKLTENSFRDVNIAFANELSVICDKLDIDVWELIRLANRHPRVNILQPGPGVGGHCIAIDPWFIVSRTPDEARLIRTARGVNDAKPEWVVAKVEETIAAYLARNPGKSASGVTICCYGLAFKANIDDLRESPAVEVAEALGAKYPGRVIAVEPNIETLPERLSSVKLAGLDEAGNADIHVMLVDHDEFKDRPPPLGELIDTRGVW